MVNQQLQQPRQKQQSAASLSKEENMSNESQVRKAPKSLNFG
jgi:hypothetical protein